LQTRTFKNDHYLEEHVYQPLAASVKCQPAQSSS